MPEPSGPSGRAGAGPPRVVLAADHRARNVMTIERYRDLLDALLVALPACDGVLATRQPLADLVACGALHSHRTYLSINRTGLAGTPFELDDRLVATPEAAAADGCTGIKHMTRIDPASRHTPAALELLGSVLERAKALGLEALIEPLWWTDGKVDRTTEAVVRAAVIAHDLGAPVLKVPVPDAEAGRARADAVRRVVESVGVPVLVLGGPRTDRQTTLAEVQDAMDGGAAGVAIGRAVYQDPDPAASAAAVAAIVRAAHP